MAFVGGLFVLSCRNLAEAVSTGLAGAIYGVILLLVIFVMPSGAAVFAGLPPPAGAHQASRMS